MEKIKEKVDEIKDDFDKKWGSIIYSISFLSRFYNFYFFRIIRINLIIIKFAAENNS